MIERPGSFGVALARDDVARTAFRPVHPGSAPAPMPATLAAAVAGWLRVLVSHDGSATAPAAARAFGMSERSYRRHLAELGTSHARLLADVRLETALDLLTDDAISVTEVAVAVGYEHPGDFARFFRRRTGWSPSDYRLSRRSA